MLSLPQFLLRRLKRARHANLVAYGLTLVSHRVAPWPRLMLLTELRRFRRVLVLAPHPDDETFGLGGLLLLLRSQPTTVRLLWLSNRDEPVRVAEALKVAAELGCAETCFPVSGAPWVQEVAAILRKEIAAFNPDLVCCPSIFEPHYDHARVAVALRRALSGRAWPGEVLQYEVWSTLVPNVLVDISSVVREKEQLMRQYASQLGEENREYVERLLALNRYRGLTHKIEVAEAFILSDAASFSNLCAPLARNDGTRSP